MNESGTIRRDLIHCFEAALARVRGRDAVRDFLRQHPQSGPVQLAAIGKAAASMALGALDVLGAAVSRGLVITKRAHLEHELRAQPHIRCLESDHPVPTETSLEAGAALWNFFDETPHDAAFLVLISGGASSLVEVLAEGWTLESLRELTQEMLGSGLTITQMNGIRKRISRIKGGRLAQRLRGRRAQVLVISDVPGDDPAVIGSGMMSPNLDDAAALPGLSAALQGRLNTLEALPGPGDAAFKAVDLHVIAKLADAKQSAAEAARGLGYTVRVHEEFLEGDALLAGKRLAVTVTSQPGVLHVFGGETTVHLPDSPGRGGRNQHLALAAALMLKDRAAYLLAAGTDGTDGPTEDAGGVVDGGTLARGESKGLKALIHLRESNSGSFLDASGDLLRTGPTGTNVMDLVLAYACP